VSSKRALEYPGEGRGSGVKPSRNHVISFTSPSNARRHLPQTTTKVPSIMNSSKFQFLPSYDTDLEAGKTKSTIAWIYVDRSNTSLRRAQLYCILQVSLCDRWNLYLPALALLIVKCFLVNRKKKTVNRGEEQINRKQVCAIAGKLAGV
jgi:hypothetical protein